MKTVWQWMVVMCLVLNALVGQQPAPDAPRMPDQPAPIMGLEPGYRAPENAAGVRFNPFEPVTDVRSDANSEAAQAMLKRIKGYVVQANGSPLLVIDGKSYRIRDKVPMNAAASPTKNPEEEGTEKTAAAVGGETATIISITPTEAVFQKDDPSGFGGETFKIFFNFKHETDDTGRQNYNVWEPVGNGFFINEEGVVVVPLSIAEGGELSVLTPYGYSKATLVESDTKRGIALLKVNVSSLPLYLADKKPGRADAVFPAGYPIDQKVPLRFLEGFVREDGSSGMKLSPEIDGGLLGSAVLNAKAEAVGIVVGQTQMLSTLVSLSPTDAIFRKYAPTKRADATGRTTRAMIEQSIVRIYKKK